jgi:hypothetical protein
MRKPRVIFELPSFLREGEETWEQVQGYPAYFVSSEGRVWSEKGDGKELTQYTNESNTYNVVGLYGQDGRQQRLVHSLVMQHFRPEGYGEYVDGEVEIHHIDGTPSNNAVENLEYVSSAENEAAKETTSQPLAEVAPF